MLVVIMSSQLKGVSFHYLSVLCVLIGLVVATFQFDAVLSLSQQWQAISQASVDLTLLDDFDKIIFVESQLPRLIMALLVGGMLGLVGSLMQQLTQNALVSPMTLGTASGAWLALVIMNVWFAEYVADYASMAALVGASLTFGLVVAIAGIRNLSGLPIVLSGMAVNIFLGAVATAIILLNEQYAKNLFIWGAGDLAQNGWDQIVWLLPKLSAAVLIFIFAPRVLALLRLGNVGAAARGLNVIPAFFGLFTVGLWLVASSITVVGVISFIGLLAPNIARHLGARTPRDELFFSLLLGATLLVGTDLLAVVLSHYTTDMIPSGTAAAFIGAPALIWFTRRNMSSQDQLSISLPKGKSYLPTGLIPSLIVGLVVVAVLAVVITKDSTQTLHPWVMMIPSEFSWELKWPRLLTSLSAGAGLAVAGVLLQRLIYNPLASPDILGISAGATLSLIGGSVFLGFNIFEAAPLVAFCGSLAVLVLLLVLGKHHQYAPSMLILTGIALTALIDALVQFSLAKGNEDSYSLLNWLAGSTYRVSPESAFVLFFCVVLLVAFSLFTHRWLTLISAGRLFAQARGLNVTKSFIALLICVALLCGAVTATMGPIAFIGLLAPHMAVLLGAKKAFEQIVVAALIGAWLMVIADWLGQHILFPSQVAAGTLVSVIGGIYFIGLLIKGQRSAH